MSRWTDIRDGALDAMKQGAMQVGEEAKQDFLANFIEAGVPVVEAYAGQFKSAVKAQATNETGWVKIRDAFVIPTAVDLGLWVGKQILQTVSGQTAAAAQA